MYGSFCWVMLAFGVVGWVEDYRKVVEKNRAVFLGDEIFLAKVYWFKTAAILFVLHRPVHKQNCIDCAFI